MAWSAAFGATARPDARRESLAWQKLRLANRAVANLDLGASAAAPEAAPPPVTGRPAGPCLRISSVAAYGVPDADQGMGEG